MGATVCPLCNHRFVYKIFTKYERIPLWQIILAASFCILPLNYFNELF